MYPNSMKHDRKMSTCKPVGLGNHSGNRPILPKNPPGTHLMLAVRPLTSFFIFVFFAVLIAAAGLQNPCLKCMTIVGVPQKDQQIKLRAAAGVEILRVWSNLGSLKQDGFFAIEL
jgi:uncharacterized membrane protein YccF (DUF307 family)